MSFEHALARERLTAQDEQHRHHLYRAARHDSLLVQAAVNATAPFLVYAFARTAFTDRIAVVAAVLTGLCSFNTVYASTQSSDAICNVIFLASIVAFVRGRRDDSAGWIAGCGALCGLAPQFRPNLVLVPLLLAAFHALTRGRSRRRTQQAALLVAVSALVLIWATTWTLILLGASSAIWLQGFISLSLRIRREERSER